MTWYCLLGILLVLAVLLMASLRAGSDDDDRAGRP